MPLDSIVVKLGSYCVSTWHQITITSISECTALLRSALVTYGNPSNKAVITCAEDGRTLEITRTCEAALQGLREKDKDRLLWEALSLQQT
jgi:hypothetical protein